MGVGCDEAGLCYAAEHGQPDRCGRLPIQPDIEAELQSAVGMEHHHD